MIRVRNNPIKKFLRDFGYRVVRLKYFIMVAVAMLLEIVTLTIYILKNEDIIGLDLFSASILYGMVSAIVLCFSVGCLVLIKTDKYRDVKKINYLDKFKKNYRILADKYSKETNNFLRNFDNEKLDIDLKINYAIVLAEKYADYFKDFSSIKVPSFLSDAFNFEAKHLIKEKQFFEEFSLLIRRDELEKISKGSDIAHRNYLEEINRIEKNLSLVI